MIRHPFQSSVAADLDTLIRDLLWVIVGLVAVATLCIVALAALLLAATHAKAGECMTLAQVRHEGGYPKFHVRHHRKCWYSAGKDAGAVTVRRHRKTSLTTADESLLIHRASMAVASDQIVGESGATADEPAFAFRDQYDPANMVRAMVPKERKVMLNDTGSASGNEPARWHNGETQRDETRPLSIMTASAGADDPVIVCDEFWRTECEPPSEHRQAVAWAIVALVVAFASVAVIVHAPARRGLRGIGMMGS